jgi:hypothetical protein
LDALAADSHFQPLAGTWPPWVRLQQLAAETIDAEQLAAGGRVEDLQRGLERFQSLAAAHAAAPGPGEGPLVENFRRRAAELAAEIQRRKQRAEADRLVEQARQAFGEDRQYSLCIADCDQLLARYAAVLDADTLAKVKLLRRRAEFWDDVGKLDESLAASTAAPRRHELLHKFLKRYRKLPATTDNERAELEKRRGQLDAIQAEIAAGARSREGLERLEQFRRKLPPSTAQRIQGAAGIFARYPEEPLRGPLQGDVRGWLAQSLPEKRIAEPEMLRELQTRDGQIVRGYFKRVSGADGALTGYKRYPSMEQLETPISEVGTFLKESLQHEPEPSLPRQCVTRYQAARAALLEQPARPAAWTQFAALCEEFDAGLRAYRARPGSSTEPLEFNAEAETARQLAPLLAQPAVQSLFQQ